MRAYQKALEAEKLGAAEPLNQEKLAQALADAETKLDAGRRDEAIGDLVYLVESSRFEPFAKLDEGRAAIFLLGDALGRAGAHDPARAYLVPLLSKSPPDVWARRAVRSLVDFGLASDRPEPFLKDLSAAPAGLPDELTSDVAFLTGRTAERVGRDDDALREFGKVTPRSRFWAQATYLSGLIEVNRRRFREGEQQFCKIADVKQTPREALAFGGSDFFEARDLARLGLGRIAHEQYRFDDSRYYYYLVPNDSSHIQEALYESANSRYEAKDYKAARDLLDEMRSRKESSRYEDEFWIFDAYVDLALCQFPQADEKLREFIKRYEPIRNAARKTTGDERALADLVDSVRNGGDPGAGEQPAEAEKARALGALLRTDPDFARVSARMGALEDEMSGLRQSLAALDDVSARLMSSKEVRPRALGNVGRTTEERADRLDRELGEVRRMIREVKADGHHAAEVQQLEAELASLEARAKDAASAESRAASAAPGVGGVADLVAGDRVQATALYAEAEKARAGLVILLRKTAKEGLERFDRRLSRLVRRARLGRIETVLGKKHALEVEMEALSEGYLPQGAVDSLEAARYLRDDEEYWPYEGEDWADEYVGGEGLH
jgi:hypothetical protein